MTLQIYIVDDRPGEELAICLEGTPEEIATLRAWAAENGFKESDQETYERLMAKVDQG